MDPADATAELADKLGIAYPILSDPDLAAARAWGVVDGENGIAWPAIFVVRPDGVVAWRSLSETYKKRAGADAILAALDSLDALPEGTP